MRPANGNSEADTLALLSSFSKKIGQRLPNLKHPINLIVYKVAKADDFRNKELKETLTLFFDFREVVLKEPWDDVLVKGYVVFLHRLFHQISNEIATDVYVKNLYHLDVLLFSIQERNGVRRCLQNTL